MFSSHGPYCRQYFGPFWHERPRHNFPVFVVSMRRDFVNHCFAKLLSIRFAEGLVHIHDIGAARCRHSHHFVSDDECSVRRPQKRNWIRQVLLYIVTAIMEHFPRYRQCKHIVMLLLLALEPSRGGHRPAARSSGVLVEWVRGLVRCGCVWCVRWFGIVDDLMCWLVVA
jgi:hypothetical protein